MDIVQRCYSDLETKGDVLWFNLSLPTEMKRLHFDIMYRQHRISVEIDQHKLRLTSRPQDISPITVGFSGRIKALASGDTLEFELNPDSNTKHHEPYRPEHR